MGLAKRDVVIGGGGIRRKVLGAVIGDEVEIGTNTVINANSVIGNYSSIGLGKVVSGIIPPNSKIL